MFTGFQRVPLNGIDKSTDTIVIIAIIKYTVKENQHFLILLKERKNIIMQSL